MDRSLARLSLLTLLPTGPGLRRRLSAKDAQRHMNRNLWRLAICQALFLTGSVTFIAQRTGRPEPRAAELDDHPMMGYAELALNGLCVPVALSCLDLKQFLSPCFSPDRAGISSLTAPRCLH